MEINPVITPANGLDRRFSRVAGITSILLGLLGIGASLAAVLMHWNGPAEIIVLPFTWMLLFALTMMAGVNMLRGCVVSQRLLLAFWLVMMILSLVLGMIALLWSPPAWWKDFLAVPLVAVLVPVLAVSIAQSVLLVLATAANTRIRYGAMVTVSVAIAIALVVTVNLIAQKDPYHKDLETLGQYGLSDRTKRVLATIDEPVQMTVIYTGTEKERRGADFRDGVLELTQEMQREFARLHKQPFKVVNVTSDAERAAILGRLQQQLACAAPEHKKLLDSFTSSGDSLAAEIEQQDKAWQALTADSYLGLWGFPAAVRDRLDMANQDLTRVRGDVQQQLARCVPNMSALTENVGGMLKEARDNLQKVSDQLERVAKLPDLIKANRADTLKSIDDSRQAVSEMVNAVGGPKEAAPKDSADTLKKFIAAANKAADSLLATGKKLTNIAGKDNVKLLEQCRLWSVTLPDARTGMATRTNVGQVLSLYGQILQARAADAEQTLADLKPEAQLQQIQAFREQVAEITADLDTQLKNNTAALDKLVNVDAASQAILKEATEKKSFAGLITPMGALIAQLEKLPELKPSSLSSDVTGENIVLVEMSNKTEVVPFDAVWPLRLRGSGVQGDGSDKRIFNGDSAITSKLLTMSQAKPFATVYLTYVAPPLPPQMAQLRMNPDVRPWNTIVARLKESNFAVKEWNLNEPMPPDEPASTQASQPSDKLPKVMLILPAPPQTRMMPNPYGPPPTEFTAAHVATIRREINKGTSALLLAHFGMESPELLDYFRNEWGADVQTDYMVFPVIADETQAGQYMVDIKRLTWLPLNNFAATPPIGLPLRSQRVLWRSLCPVAKTPIQAKDGQAIRTVEYQSLLGVPKARDIWAISKGNLEQAAATILSRSKDTIAPAAGDIFGPFDVAVALSGSKNQAVQDNRVVVSSMAASLMDPYLTMPIEDKPGKFADPPKADVDFVSNSVYWLIGRPQYIGSGPAQIRPVEISDSQMKIVWPTVVIGLPLVLLGIGGLVMLSRRTR